MPSDSPYQRKARISPAVGIVGLIITLAFMGAIAVMVLKVTDEAGSNTQQKQSQLDQFADPSSTVPTTSGVPVARKPTAAACLLERQTLQDAETISQAANGGPQTVEQMLADRTITTKPSFLTVVLTPGGGYEIRSIVPGTCP